MQTLCAAETCYKLTTNNYDELALNNRGEVVIVDNVPGDKYGKTAFRKVFFYFVDFTETKNDNGTKLCFQFFFCFHILKLEIQ